MSDNSDLLTRVARAKKGFVRAYGLFWSAAEVDWDVRKGSAGGKQILGRVNRSAGSMRLADFWDQKGIYVLSNDYGAYYVGKTARLTLGQRLQEHRSPSSKHLGNWDRFSWFGFRAVLKSMDHRGLNVLGSMPETLLTSNEDTIGDIEALLILSLGTLTRGNARNETFAVAQKFEQVLWHERDDVLAKVQRN